MPTLNFQDLSLFYKQAGSGIPILLIHGTLPDADIWGTTFDQLAQEHRVIAYDRRGYSRSVHQPEMDYLRHAEDAAEILRALVQEPAIVLGWSWGGIVALELAAAHPELVKRLVMVEPALHLKKHLTFNLFQTVFAVQLQRRITSEEKAAETFLRWALHSTNGESVYDRLNEQAHQVVQANAHAILKEIDAGTGEALLASRISSIACPVDIVLGECTQPELFQAANRLHEILPQSTMQSIKGASHAVHLTHSEALVDLIST